MGSVYIEARPEDHDSESKITDYVVKNRADRILSIHNTEAEAVRWARERAQDPLVGRACHLNDKRIPHHWRSA